MHRDRRSVGADHREAIAQPQTSCSVTFRGAGACSWLVDVPAVTPRSRSPATTRGAANLSTSSAAVLRSNYETAALCNMACLDRRRAAALWPSPPPQRLPRRPFWLLSADPAYRTVMVYRTVFRLKPEVHMYHDFDARVCANITAACREGPDRPRGSPRGASFERICSRAAIGAL